jgi:hypothetical protein
VEPDPAPRKSRPWHLRFYRTLLYVFPTTFRARFGDEMTQLFDDMLRSSSGGAVGLWSFVLRDTLSAGLRERREQMKRSTLALLSAATVAGLTIAWVDSRPTWDDTGVTAGALLLTSALFGAVGPRTPWLWAIAIGAWIPMHGIVRDGNWTTLLVLGITFTGAYIGAALRRVFVPPDTPTGDRP